MCEFVREMERERGRERDRETGRQGDRETGRQGETKITICVINNINFVKHE